MKRSNGYRAAALVLAWTLAAGTIPLHVSAAGTAANFSQRSAASTSIGSVSFLTKSSIEIKELGMLASEEGKLVAFTVTFHNNEDKELQLIDYWIRLQNKVGTAFTVSVLPQDKDKNRVPAHSKVDVNMYAKVNKDTKLQDLIFKIVRWDFSTSNYEKKIGELKVPADYTAITKAGQSRMVVVSGAAVKMQPVKMDAGKNAEYFLPKIIFRMENTDTKAADIPNYQFSIKTKEGLVYPLEVKGLEEGKRTLLPRFVKELELTGTMPLSVGADGWELLITSTLESGIGGSKQSLPVAFFSLPKSGVIKEDKGTPIPVSGTKVLEVNSQKLETKVKQVSRTKLDTSYNVQITFGMKNAGTGAVTLPDYRFAIRTADGFTYPVRAEGVKDSVIAPLFSKDAQLTVNIPTSVKAEGWKLLMMPPVDSSTGATNDTALAIFLLGEDATDLGKENAIYDFVTAAGKYSAVLKGVQRLPWEDEDILSASLTISNRGTKPLSLPSFGGYFMLDDTIRVPAEALLKDSVISIKAGGQVNLVLHGKIPYTNEYSSIKLVLQEKGEGSAAADLLIFRSGSAAKPLPVIPAKGSHKLEGTGRQADVTVRDVRTYTSESYDLFNVQLTVQNLEKRQAAIGSLVGYFSTSDGTVYPATLSEVKNKIAPQGTALLSVFTSLPKGTKTTDLRLIMGTGVKGGKLGQFENPDSYIDAVSFSLPFENKELKTDFKDIDLYPYTFNISSLTMDARFTGFKLGFNYKLSRNQLVELHSEEQKLVVQFEDAVEKIRVEKSFGLGKQGSDNLILGSGSFTLDSPDIQDFIFRLDSKKKYKFRIYEELKGQRKLLVERELNYLSNYYN